MLGRCVLLFLLYPLYRSGECDDTLLDTYYDDMMVMAAIEGSVDLAVLIMIGQSNTREQRKRRVEKGVLGMAVTAVLCWVVFFIAYFLSACLGVKQCARFAKGKWW